MCIGSHVTGRYFCPILMKLEISPQIFEKDLNMKFNENPSNGNQVVPGGGTETHDSLLDNFAKVPKKYKRYERKYHAPSVKSRCLSYNLKIHSDNRIKEPKTRKACCIYGTAEKFNNISIRNYTRGDTTWKIPSQHERTM